MVSLQRTSGVVTISPPLLQHKAPNQLHLCLTYLGLVKIRDSRAENTAIINANQYIAASQRVAIITVVTYGETFHDIHRRHIHTVETNLSILVVKPAG